MERTAVLSILANIGLTALKYSFAILSGSIALIADSIHSLTDVIASSAVLVGLKISKRKSETFPYGLYKVENIVSLFISLAIFWAGYGIAREALFAPARELRRIPVTLISVVVTIISTYFLSRYKISVGEKTRSPSIKADGYHTRTDMFSSIAVLIGLAGSAIGINLDKIAALVVLAFIVRAGYFILADALRVLLDASLDFETLDKVKSIIIARREVVKLKSLKGRNSGRYRFIEADIILKVRDLEKAYHLTQRIERDIRENIENVDDVIIHYEPVEKDILYYAFPLENIEEGENTPLSKHYGEAPYIAIVKVRAADRAMLDKEIIANPFLEEEKGKGILLSEMLIDRDVDVLVLKEKFKGKGPEYALSDSNVEVIITERDSLEETLEDLGIRPLISGEDVQFEESPR